MTRKTVKVGLAIAVALAVVVTFIVHVRKPTEPLRLLSEAEAVERARGLVDGFRVYVKEETLELLSARLLSAEEWFAEENGWGPWVPDQVWVVEFKCEGVVEGGPWINGVPSSPINRVRVTIDAYTGRQIGITAWQNPD